MHQCWTSKNILLLISIEMVDFVAEMLVYVILTQAGVTGGEGLISSYSIHFLRTSTLRQLTAMQCGSRSDVRHEVSDKESAPL